MLCLSPLDDGCIDAITVGGRGELTCMGFAWLWDNASIVGSTGAGQYVPF